MTLRDPTRSRLRAHLVGVVAEYGALVNEGGIAFRCNIQITKQVELRFHAVQVQGICELKLALV
jgi:hypothetical protein